MKNFTLILLLLCFIWTKAQTKPGNSKKELQKNTAVSKYNSANTNNLVPQLMHDTCIDKKFSVVFYLIQDSSYSLPTLNPLKLQSYSLTAIIQALNSTFSCICVSFEHCKTVIIPNYPYNNWRHAETGTVVPNNWYTDNTINFYIPEEILGTLPDAPENGYATPLPPNGPLPPKFQNYIIVKRELVLSGGILMHAMGHFFGLPHTNSEINPAGASTVIPAPPTNASPPILTLEYADRTNLANCYTHGDGFCDTEADPYPSIAVTNTFVSADNNCAMFNGLKDGHGNFYVPPCDNFMSGYGTRCRFSTEQYYYMAKTIIRKRLYLH